MKFLIHVCLTVTMFMVLSDYMDVFDALSLSVLALISGILALASIHKENLFVGYCLMLLVMGSIIASQLSIMFSSVIVIGQIAYVYLSNEKEEPHVSK